MSAGQVGLLLVENDPQEEQRLRQMLAAASAVFEVTVAGSVTDAAAQLTARRFDVLLLDLSMVADGLEPFWAVCPGHADLPIVALTPAADQQLARQAIQHGAQEYLPKDEVTGPLLVRALRHARERHRWLGDRTRQLHHELQMAALLQERLLPSASPILAGYELGAYLQAGGQIGGDFYDYLELSHGRVGLVLGDASGKGIPGALLMASTQGIVRAEAVSERAAGEVIGRVNGLVYRGNAPDQFVTLLYVVLSARDREIRYVNAGHPRALLIRSRGVQLLPATGPPLGVFADARYDEEAATAGSGDILVLYSDGVTEAQTAQDDYFDEAGIRDVVHEHRDCSPSTIARAICEAAERFEASNPDGGDDKAVIVARITDL